MLCLYCTGLFVTAIFSNCGAALLLSFIKLSPVLDHRTKHGVFYCFLNGALPWKSLWTETSWELPGTNVMKGLWKCEGTRQNKQIRIRVTKGSHVVLIKTLLIPLHTRYSFPLFHAHSIQFYIFLQRHCTSDVQQDHWAQHPQAKLFAHTTPCRCIQPETHKPIPMISSETSFQFSKKLDCQLSHLWQLSPSAALPPVHKPSFCSLLQSYDQFPQGDSRETVLAVGDTIIGNNSGPKNGIQTIIPLDHFLQHS